LTTGVLLRRLQEDPELEGVSHIIVDEVLSIAAITAQLLYAAPSHWVCIIISGD
jgi:hypothetical protein